MVKRIVCPYKDTQELSGLEVVNAASGLSAKIFYVTGSTNIVGQTVNAGDVIGSAQSLQQRYPRITDHVHLEIRVNGKTTSPVTFINGAG